MCYLKRVGRSERKENILIGFAGFPIARASLWSLCLEIQIITLINKAAKAIWLEMIHLLGARPTWSLDSNVRGGSSSGRRDRWVTTFLLLHSAQSIYWTKDESFLWARKTEKERVTEPMEANSDTACTVLKEQPNWVIESFRRTPSVLK